MTDNKSVCVCVCVCECMRVCEQDKQKPGAGDPWYCNHEEPNDHQQSLPITSSSSRLK